MLFTVAFLSNIVILLLLGAGITVGTTCAFSCISFHWGQ